MSDHMASPRATSSSPTGGESKRLRPIRHHPNFKSGASSSFSQEGGEAAAQTSQQRTPSAARRAALLKQSSVDVWELDMDELIRELLVDLQYDQHFILDEQTVYNRLSILGEEQKVNNTEVWLYNKSISHVMFASDRGSLTNYEAQTNN